MTFRYRYRKQIMIGTFLLIVLLLSGSICYICFGKRDIKIKKEKVPVLASLEIEKEEKEEKVWYQIDIKGQVQNPGLYKIDAESRVMDAIILAGGFREFADTTVLNLSKKVFDEMVIIVYSQEEVANFSKTLERMQKVEEKCIQKEEGSMENDACFVWPEEEQTQPLKQKISINDATLEQLQMLPGIGSSKAEAILSYRVEHGKFTSIEEIKEVEGIGEALFVKIKDYITV